MPRPFRFGLSAWSAGSRAEWQDLARRVEDLGFSTLVVPDHAGEQLSPFPALLSAADATSTLRLGTLVLDTDFRPPALVGMEAATVDLLTDGRLELGLGAGWLVDDYEMLGLSFDPPGARVDRLEAAVPIVKERLASAGRAVPLLLGGNGRRLLALAAREADVVGFTGLTVPREGGLRVGRDFTAEGATDKVAHVREQAGERFGALELNVLVQAVVPDLDSLRGQLADLSDEDVLESPFVLVGDTAAMVDTLLERRERFGISYVIAFAERGGLAQLAPVVAALAGA